MYVFDCNAHTMGLIHAFVYKQRHTYTHNHYVCERERDGAKERKDENKKEQENGREKESESPY